MKILRITIALISLTFFVAFTCFGSTSKTTVHDPKDSLNVKVELKQLTALNIDNYEAFKIAIMPLIDEMATKKFVSLGEGTHGTSEFYKVRYWITKILVEEKGFNHVAFENDYSDSRLLSQELQMGNQDYHTLMKNYLISIWQNKETEELFKWMQSYNSGRKRKVEFEGLDNVFMEVDAKALKSLLSKNKNEELKSLLNDLQKYSAFQDSIWRNQNIKEFTYNGDSINNNGVKGYNTAMKIEQLLDKLKLSSKVKMECQGFLMNSKQGFSPFYQWVTYKRGSSRDSCMAVMASWIAPKKDDKVIIWAHNAHVARKGIYGGAVGGTGGFIEKQFPGQYFVVGTGTATGTFSATHDNFDTRENIMASYPLEKPIDGSWEKGLEEHSAPAFYFSTVQLKHKSYNLQHRHIGYTPFSGKNSYDPTNLSDLYDGFIFIRETKAAEFIK